MEDKKIFLNQSQIIALRLLERDVVDAKKYYDDLKKQWDGLLTSIWKENNISPKESGKWHLNKDRTALTKEKDNRPKAKNLNNKRGEKND